MVTPPPRMPIARSSLTSSSRAVPGHRLRGTRPRARSVVWPLLVYGDTQESWFVADKGFWHSISPDQAGTWRVSVGAQVRELRLTAMFSSDDEYESDPYYNGWAKYVCEMEAQQPYWTGQTVIRTFEIGPTSPVDFFDAAGSPPFHITPGSTFSTATITNPGDVPAYPVWTAVGPLDDIQLGVGTVTIDVPFNLATDEVLRIDTDPRNQPATLDGDDVTATLGFQPLAPVDPGEDRALTVVATETGTITCEIVPLFYRAF